MYKGLCKNCLINVHGRTQCYMYIYMNLIFIIWNNSCSTLHVSSDTIFSAYCITSLSFNELLAFIINTHTHTHTHTHTRTHAHTHTHAYTHMHVHTHAKKKKGNGIGAVARQFVHVFTCMIRTDYVIALLFL